jgi:uncharacterized protein (DUF2147 family)
MKYLLPLMLLFTASIPWATLSAQTKESVLGHWKTIDDETGKAKSIVELSIRNGKLYGKVVEILNPEKRNMLCTLCEGNKKDQPVMGMEIVWDMQWDEDDKEWEDGTILDPNKGSTYDCEIWIDKADPNKLNVRGYVAFFFRTQNWFRQP